MKRRKTSTSTTEKRQQQQQREGKGEEEKKKKKRKKNDERETLSEIGPFRIPNFEEEDALLTARTVAHIVREIVQFLLFNRNQIPLMFADLVSLRRVEQKEEEEEEDPNEENAKEKTKKKRKRKSSRRSEKKLFNQIAQIERLMESLSEEEFASRQPVKRVAVCFGATVNRPVETYIIDLEDVRYSATRGEGGEEEEAQSEKKTKSAANRIVRAVMPHVAGLRTNPSRTSQKIWIFLKHEDAADNDDENDDEKNTLRAELSNRFAMKRNLNGLFEAEEKEERRGTRKNVKGSVFARIVLKSSSKPSSSSVVPASSCSWYQSRLVSKGFRFKESAAGSLR